MDRSGSSHYSIGALIFPVEFYAEFQNIVLHAKKNHQFLNEIKWSKTHKGYNLINIGLRLFYEILINKAIHYQCITVEKAHYRNWITSKKEEAFYKTLTQLIAKSTEMINDDLVIECDEKNDRYDKHHEVCQIISNHFLSPCTFAKVKDVKTCDSKNCDAIQVADYITGAINASHRYHQNNNININRGKLKCIELMSKILGWDNLAWDTWKNDKFNIWAFPIESRASRGASKNIDIAKLIPPVYLSSF
ncbi:DUF3800 domain-containing protein [Legionella sp.]|uniref:DUF3800 domain-containing protein n=1 Tax=Legionella sp. TaxID=459 RepID=UPI003CBE11EF